MLHLLDQSPQQFLDWFAERNLPGYRAKQVHSWIFARGAKSFDQMTDLPSMLREQLAEAFHIWTTQVAAHQKADDGTKKLLIELADGQRVECVLLSDDGHRRTICISTQVGCAMGCAFCASGIDGLVRNLNTGEIVEQMLRLRQSLAEGERLSHIVVMGMGEPLANLDALLPALATATDPKGLGISARRVTISTVGIPRAICRLADEDRPYHLAVSLHAADNTLRDRLVPANRCWPIADVLVATDHYFQQTGRRVTFEYVLLDHVNSEPEHAKKLVDLLRGRPVLVNLIPLNPVAELPFSPPRSADVTRFAEVLREAGLTVKIRYRKGERIDAACGQLRRNMLDIEPTDF